MRDAIYKEIESIQPLDTVEETHKEDCLAWIKSGAKLCRIEKPDIPPKHLVSYFVLVDGDHVLLVDHKNAQLWLPTGGHVEPDEHPRTTVVREAKEELGIEAEFLCQQPIFVTVSETTGFTAGHFDVSLWYIIKGTKDTRLNYDEGEFQSIKWFRASEIPLERSDPNMGRFLQKLALVD